MLTRYQAIFLVFLCCAAVHVVCAESGEELFEIGNTFFDNSSFTEAIQSWEKAVEADPTLAANAWYNIGLAYAGQENYEQAVIAWDKTIEVAPNSAVAYDNKGTALAILGRYDEALSSYNNAIRLKPDQIKFKADRDLLIENMKKTKSPISPITIIGAVIAVVGVIARYRRRS
ncbi:MAG TPA: tetratricopeptide repeat protein [Methanospirillum sp.]|nr:tetratricopeptide repeat protein [Methanospirillum sp.]